LIPGALVRTQGMAKLTTIWVVRDPSPLSIMADILYRVDSPNEMARVIIGTGYDQFMAEHTTFYTDEAEARADAEQRMANRSKKERTA